MNLEYLRTFIELVELGSFSEVAARRGLSQPAISFQVQKLERDLGVRLLDRSRRGIVLTDAGRRLHQSAQRIVVEADRLQMDLQQMQEEVVGDLYLAASTIPGEVLLPPLLAEFKSLHPAVRASVEISDSLTVLSGIKNGTFEIGFCGVPPTDETLEHFKVGEDEIVLIVFPEHPFAGSGEVAPQDLIGEPLIVRSETSGTQQTVNSALAALGVDVGRQTPHLVLGTHQAVVSAVEARAGIAFVSSLAAAKSLALGLVRLVSVRGLALRRDFHCVYSRESLVSRLPQEFVSFTRGRAPLT